MEIGSKPITSLRPDAGELTRVHPATPTDAVRTDLPPSKAVQAPQRAAATDPDLGQDPVRPRPPAISDFIDRHLSIDLQTRVVVFQAVDQRDGYVICQIPDEALLRLKAYQRKMRVLEAESAAAPMIERVA